MSWFRTQAVIEADMLQDLEDLTGLKLSSDDVSREEVIKIKQAAIAIEHVYAQIDRVADDFFPGSASEPALEKHLAARGMSGREAAQPSNGTIRHTGTVGTVILTGNRVRRTSNGALYYLKADATIGAGGTVDAAYQSVLDGQAQNDDILDDDFEMVTPQAGVDTACLNVARFLDGRDIETPAEMLERIRIHDQEPDTGGNLIAYERFAKEASDAVVTAQAIKNPRGQDTVDVVITSGTTDIEAAVLNGDSVERVPSDALVAAVQAYVEEQNPTTDDVLVVKPTEDNFDSTITYDLYDETLRDQVDIALTQVWKIYVYSVQSGEDADPTALERAIDAKVGHLVVRRRVSNFGGGSPNYSVPEGHILKPHTLTLGAF
jgi:uncharacterized phage protein gp47/JayE